MSELPEQTSPGTASISEWKAHARQIADQLGEQHGGPRRQIERIVRAIGAEHARTLAEEALAIQTAGGEPTLNGHRPRTPGGIFFRLVRRLGTENATIHRMFMAHPPGRHTAGGSHPSPIAPVTWGDRLASLEDILGEIGGAKTMKITLTGRPGKVVDKGTYILTTMPPQKIPALPKGLPPLPSDAQPPQTLVLVAKKQWVRVEAALGDPADTLILEGFALYEPAVRGLAILATNVTTAALQRAKRQPQNASTSELAQQADE
jgi:hypothetical protein